MIEIKISLLSKTRTHHRQTSSNHRIHSIEEMLERVLMLELCLIDLVKDPFHVNRDTIHHHAHKTGFLQEEHEGFNIVLYKFRFFFISTYRVLYHHHL